MLTLGETNVIALNIIALYFSFYVVNDNCVPSLAVGYAIHLATNISVDIFIGPPCSAGQYW